jgi:hypothetical protein
MSDDHREDGNCPYCGAALNEYGSFKANYTQCNKCDKKWSIIDKPIDQFSFDSCPKCGGKDLQVSCSDQRLCNACSFLWMPGDEENGKYNSADGKPCPAKGGSSCPGGGGGCCGGGCCGGCNKKTAEAATKSACGGGGCCGKGLGAAPAACGSYKGQMSALKAAIEAAIPSCTDPGAAAGLAACAEYIGLNISLCGG